MEEKLGKDGSLSLSDISSFFFFVLTYSKLTNSDITIQLNML